MTISQPSSLLSTRLLVVADTTAARAELTGALASIAMAQVQETASIAGAVDDAQAERVDLVIIDLEMSGSAAVTLTRKLRDPAAFRDRGIAILLVGGSASTLQYVAAMRLGVEGYLPRPFTDERLRQAVRTALVAAPRELIAPPLAAPRKSQAPIAPVAAEAEVPEPHVPVANKPFRHGLQALMRVVQPLSPDEAFGFETLPARRLGERKAASYTAFPFPARRLSTVS